MNIRGGDHWRNWWSKDDIPCGHTGNIVSASLEGGALGKVITFFPDCPHVCIGGSGKCCHCRTETIARCNLHRLEEMSNAR